MSAPQPITWVVANWKMNLLGADASALASAVVNQLPQRGSVRVLLAPPHPYLERVASCLAGSRIGVAAQDLHWGDPGACTGAVGGAMLADAGATHVLVGHSERRQIFGDDDGAVRRKLQAAVAAGLTPILCVGESLVARQAGHAQEVVQAQLAAALEKPSSRERIMVAYEPVWAIGSGQVASAGQAAEMHGFIRRLLGGRATVLYGGSVAPSSVADLLAEAEIDGLLVGGASLHMESFSPILEAAGARA